MNAEDEFAADLREELRDRKQVDLDLAFRTKVKRDREAQAMERAMTEDQLLADAKANLLVLRTLHNVPITDAQIEERANNLVAGVMGNYRIERLLP